MTVCPFSAGESVDDCGGGYSESIAEMCEELEDGSVVPLLVPTPNGRSDSGANRDCLILNPRLSAENKDDMFRFLGNDDCCFTSLVMTIIFSTFHGKG